MYKNNLYFSLLLIFDIELESYKCDWRHWNILSLLVFILEQSPKVKSVNSHYNEVKQSKWVLIYIKRIVQLKKILSTDLNTFQKHYIMLSDCVWNKARKYFNPSDNCYASQSQDTNSKCLLKKRSKGNFFFVSQKFLSNVIRSQTLSNFKVMKQKFIRSPLAPSKYNKITVLDH